MQFPRHSVGIRDVVPPGKGETAVLTLARLGFLPVRTLEVQYHGSLFRVRRITLWALEFFPLFVVGGALLKLLTSVVLW